MVSDMTAERMIYQERMTDLHVIKCSCLMLAVCVEMSERCVKKEMKGEFGQPFMPMESNIALNRGISSSNFRILAQYRHPQTRILH